MTKTIAISGLTALACLLGAVGTAQAQQPAHEALQPQAQEYSFPSRDGSYSPASTLRITEQPQAGAVAPEAVRDTPESLAAYKRCRDNADRASNGHMQLQSEVAACLRDLEARRQN